MEGVLLPGSLPNRNNNPGDIEYGRFARAHGATMADNPRYSRFKSLLDGYRAMQALLQQPAYKGLDIYHAIYEWLGYTKAQADAAVNTPDEPGNYPKVYIANVCEWTGLAPTTIIDDHLELPPALLASAA